MKLHLRSALVHTGFPANSGMFTSGEAAAHRSQTPKVCIRILEIAATCAILMVTSPCTGQSDISPFSDESLLVPAAAGSQKFDTLAGVLPKFLPARPHPYLVVADLEVPAGRTVVVEAGAILLFRNFTGMHIIGRLRAEGTDEKPVVFSSEYDRNFNPHSSLIANPYDWNGIYVHDNAFGSILSHCAVRYSVYGLISDTKFIKIINCFFNSNGKSDLVITGEPQPTHQQPFSYQLTLSDAEREGVPIDFLKDPSASRRTILRYSSLVGFLAGAGVSIVYSLQWHSSATHLRNLQSTEDDNLINNSKKVFLRVQNQRNLRAAAALGGVTLAIVSGIGFRYSFTF